jgi:hypothetical protein
MAIFRRTPEPEPTPETLEFLADAETLVSRQIRRDNGRSTAQENAAEAADAKAAGFRQRAANARKAR